MKRFTKLLVLIIFLIFSVFSFAINDYKALLVGDDKGNVTKV